MSFPRIKKISFLILLLIIFGVFSFSRNTKESTNIPTQISEPLTANNNTENNPIVLPSANAEFQPPLDRASERVTKKPFGIYITPKTSPVQPERFSGYHTGTDFEVFSDELDSDVSVMAVCSGKLLIKKYASGYGGVAVQSCMLDNNPITVIYGHLKLASINLAVGDNISTGDTLGILGKAYSQETSGERKHLHLGFHRGTGINILGYVQNKKDLSDWIDPCLYACQS